MFYQVKSYLKFLLRSTNQHGLHSPFVYDLATKCFYDKQNYPDYKKLESYSKELLKNKTKITVTDFGAGSKKLRNNLRTISSIAQNAGITKKRAQLLYRLVRYFNSENILEIGTSLGIATSSLALANPKTEIFSLEGCPETATIAKNQLEKFKIKNVAIQIGEFNKTLPKVLETNNFDLIYIDGNHQKEPTIRYFELCLKHIHNDSVFIFDDIYWSKGMCEAWNYIKEHPKVTVSIDTFQWGLAFFRKEQAKQHLIVRI
ncbi:MAG: class I SAM-dependent methyltransferase [Flavobacteriaceae bacterium]|nr:class I SAM-dependent methyltransferase [Flavobacteriaceae bacterium]